MRLSGCERKSCIVERWMRSTFGRQREKLESEYNKCGTESGKGMSGQIPKVVKKVC
jgi:hypothetical protein